MMNPADQIDAIRSGKLQQFSPLIQILAAKLAIGGAPLEVRLPRLADALWMPPCIVLPNGSIMDNPGGIVLGVQINTTDAPILPFGLAAAYLSRFHGVVEVIYVTLLAGAAANVYFLATRGVSLYYSGFTVGGGTPDGSSAIIAAIQAGPTT